MNELNSHEDVYNSAKDYTDTIAATKVDLKVGMRADYVVTNETELDNALAEAENNNGNYFIYIMPGTYDKGSPFYIPAVTNLTIWGYGAIILKPSLNPAFVLKDGTHENLIIRGIKFDGTDRNSEHGLIEGETATTRIYGNSMIIDCIFNELISGYGIKVNFREVKIYRNRFYRLKKCLLETQYTVILDIQNNFFHLGGSDLEYPRIYEVNGGRIEKYFIFCNNRLSTWENSLDYVIFFNVSTSWMRVAIIHNNNFYIYNGNVIYVVFDVHGNMTGMWYENALQNFNSSKFTNRPSGGFLQVYNNYQVA